MVRVFTFAVGLLLLARPVAADDLIAPDTVAAIKKATVYVRVEGDGWVASGSGFVVAADAKVVLFATNHHVAVPKPKAPPRPGAKPPTITVVLDSGTRTERSIRAEIVADDSETDLTILRITSLKDAPKPIAHADAAKLVETMPVYSFGFPFGTALSTGKGFPAVTVGKASISSLRNGDNGELAVVQIDGNLNPGNSGGPVVDAKGRLVGVAVATIRDGQGIGLTIPAAELSKILRGRIGHVRIIRGKAGNGPLKVRIEADLIDPSGNLRSPTARYFVVGAKAKRPDPPLEKLSGSKTIELNVERGIASAEFMVDKGEGEVLVQVSASAGAGKPLVASRVSAYSLAPTPTGADFVGPPPTGWKEYSPRDKTFVMWVPDRPTKQAEAQRNTTIGGRRMRVNSVVGRTASGLVYEAESLLLPATVAKVARKELHDLIRSAIVSERRGRVTDSKDVQSGSLHGVEYVIESGSAVTRARVFVVGTRIYTVLVTGSAAQVAGAEGETLLSSYRHPTASVIAKGPTQVPAGNELTIQGGRLDPGFKDVSSDGALLVGLEVVVGKPIRDELIQSVRPIYRVGGKESFGAWFGTDTKNAVTIKAKTGYAIGAISAKARNVCDGFSVTFMRVVGNKLDPKDSYESDWIGWNGNWRVTKVGGDGTPAVGIAVKVGVVPRGNEKDVTGFGLLFKGQEAFNPNAVRPNVVHRGKDPTILGGVFDPEFKEIAPPGGVLIGFEIGQARAFNRDMIRSIRPIYRTGDKESSGVQRGTQLSNVSTVKAKAGYAVGAITVKHGLGFDGMSVTFMKLSGGKLDPTDTYESDWFGTDERKIPSKLGGDGTLVIGIVGKTNAKDMTGMGLLFKGQEAYEPKKK